MFEKESWASNVSRVFYTQPRDGNDKSTLWLERKELEQAIERELDLGMHICLDGPTGTGKSSLATTILKRKKIRYHLIQLTKQMTWVDFCFRVVKRPEVSAGDMASTVEFGMDKGLPTFKAKLELGIKDSTLDDLELRERISKSITEADVCAEMASKDIALFIDDFEKASSEIADRISDMCKLLTESYVSSRAKMIIVGTDDIYKRLIHADKSLKDRISEISIGTLPTKNESWRFLYLGFEKLDLHNPVSDFRKNYVTGSQLKECATAIYEAANGLPKSLNILGREICLNARWDRKRISVADVLNTSQKMPQKNLEMYSSEFPHIINCAQGNVVVAAILRYFYKRGIGKIHNWNDLVIHISPKFPEEQIDNAIMELVKIGFLMRTGFNNDVLFVNDPPLAHTLGVIAYNPKKYDAPDFLYSSAGQLTLAFLSKD